MKHNRNFTIRPATADDAPELAKLIDIAGEGIPTWLWTKSAAENQSALDIGVARARREEGGFSYRNAIVAERAGHVLGMALSYPIDAAPQEDPDDLPAPIAPFVALEARSVGTWYVNALAVFAATQGEGIGTRLLAEVESAARAAGYAQLSIQVYGQNAGAVRLYHRFGFQTVDRAPVRLHPSPPYYTGDVLLLTKPVAQVRAA